MGNSVQVTSTGQVVVTEVANQAIELGAASGPLTVEVQTPGPQGPQGLQGPPGQTHLSQLEDVDATRLANGSTLVYDATAGKWIGSADTSVDEILNGGAF